MRKAIDRTEYQPLDLGDQPPGEYLLRFEKAGHPATILWVDSVEEPVLGGCWVGKRGGIQVVAFSTDYTWFTIHRDLVETLSQGDLQELVRVNAADGNKAYLDFVGASQVGIAEGLARNLNIPESIRQRLEGRGDDPTSMFRGL